MRSKNEGRALENYEQMMKHGHEMRRRTIHKEYLKEVAQHAKDFIEFHKKKYSTLKKRAAQCRGHLEQ